MIQDPTVNQHQHMTFMLYNRLNLPAYNHLNKQILITFSPALITIQRKKCNQLFMHRNVAAEITQAETARPKCPVIETARLKWPDIIGLTESARPKSRVPSVCMPCSWM